MKLEQLHCFLEAVKYNSISEAAEKNFMSQSTVSYSILNLEKELGIDLLKRSNTGVTPTLMGEQVLQKAEEIFKSVEDIIEMAKEQRSYGTVNITCIPCICDWIIPETINILKEKASDIVLSVNTAESSMVAHAVSTGASGFGIVISYEGLFQNSDLHYTPLFADEYMLYVGRNSPLWEREGVTYEEFRRQPYIAYRDEFTKYCGGLTNMLEAEEMPNIIFRTDDLDSIKSMITQNDYVAFFPRYMSRNDIYVGSGHIRRIPVIDRKLEFQVGYVESKKYKLKKIDKLVLSVMKETVGKLAL